MLFNVFVTTSNLSAFLFIFAPFLFVECNINLKCFTGSYVIKNWQPCSMMPPGMSLWVDRCNRVSLPQCTGYSGCPEYGVLPCQYSAVNLVDSVGSKYTIVDSAAQRNGESRCIAAEDMDVCDYGYDKCYKMIETYYNGPNIDRWVITKKCGGCPLNLQVKQNCDVTTCLGSPKDCPSTCFFKSTDSFMVARCADCSSDRCNRAQSRRVVHHLLAISFGTLAMVLLLRKCRA